MLLIVVPSKCIDLLLGRPRATRTSARSNTSLEPSVERFDGRALWVGLPRRLKSRMTWVRVLPEVHRGTDELGLDPAQRTVSTKVGTELGTLRARLRIPQLQLIERKMAPQAGFEPATLRLTAGCSAVRATEEWVGRLRESVPRGSVPARPWPRRTSHGTNRFRSVNAAGPRGQAGLTAHGSWLPLRRSRLTGSRLTAHGSRLTAHGSRLTAHGSRLTKAG